MQDEQQGSIWNGEKIARLELFKSPALFVGWVKKETETQLPFVVRGAGCCCGCQRAPAFWKVILEGRHGLQSVVKQITRKGWIRYLFALSLDASVEVVF